MNPTHYLGEVRSLTGKNQLPAAFGQLKKLPGHSPQPGRALEQRANREVVLRIVSGTATPADPTDRKGATSGRNCLPGLPPRGGGQSVAPPTHVPVSPSLLPKK